MAYKHFYKMYIYIYISDIFVAVYALNARGSVRNIRGLYAAVQFVQSANPESVFQWSPIPDIEKVCRSLSLSRSLSQISRSLHVKKSIIPKRNRKEFPWPLTNLHFFPLFSPEQFYAGVWLFLTSNCYWILMHASLNDFPPFCLLAAIPTLMSWLYFLFLFLLSEGGHNVITTWHKVQNFIFFVFKYFGMGFFFLLLHPWFGFHGLFFPLVPPCQWVAAKQRGNDKKTRQIHHQIIS